MRKKYNKTYQCKSWLEKEYIEKKLSLYEIAKACQVSSETIRNWMLKFDISRRSIKEAMELKKKSVPEDERLRDELILLDSILEEVEFILRVLKDFKQFEKMEKEEKEDYLRRVRREQKQRHAADRFRKKAERERLKASLDKERKESPVDKTLEDEWREIEALFNEPLDEKKRRGKR